MIKIIKQSNNIRAKFTLHIFIEFEYALTQCGIIKEFACFTALYDAPDMRNTCILKLNSIAKIMIVFWSFMICLIIFLLSYIDGSQPLKLQIIDNADNIIHHTIEKFSLSIFLGQNSSTSKREWRKTRSWPVCAPTEE